jgi:hypothetical protein
VEILLDFSKLLFWLFKASIFFKFRNPSLEQPRFSKTKIERFNFLIIFLMLPLYTFNVASNTYHKNTLYIDDVVDIS